MTIEISPLGKTILWLKSLNLRLFVTHNFNLNISPEIGQKPLQHFYNQVQRGYLGRNWCRKPAAVRITTVGFWEHLLTNTHIHVLVRIPTDGEDWLRANGERIWNNMQPRGQLHIDEGPIKNIARVTPYCTKEWRTTDYLDRLFVYSPY